MFPTTTVYAAKVYAATLCADKVFAATLYADIYPALKLKFRKFPAIHTNYIISHRTTLQCNHNIWHYLGRKEILNTKNNEFNSAAIFLLLHTSKAYLLPD